MLENVPEEIGGWPRTAATEAAVAFTAEHSPEWLLNHTVRSYFYARSIATARKSRAGR